MTQTVPDPRPPYPGFTRTRFRQHYHGDCCEWCGWPFDSGDTITHAEGEEWGTTGPYCCEDHARQDIARTLRALGW